MFIAEKSGLNVEKINLYSCMKLRIKGNAIRLRLTKTDVKDLEQYGMVTEHTNFGNAVFNYSLQKKIMRENLSASFMGNNMTVFISEKSVEELVHTDKVSVKYIQQTENASGLFLLVEKDFKCLDESPENQEDMYEHPGKLC